MDIIPAILERSYGTIEDRVNSIPEVQVVHVDICDGVFVESKTWPYTSTHAGALEKDDTVRRLLAEEVGLPRWEDVEYQFDLMVQDVHNSIDMWARLGAGTLIFHPTAFTDINDLSKAVTHAKTMLSDTGIALTYDEWIQHKESLHALLISGEVDILQCMSIKHIGSQHEPFDDRWLKDISDIKTMYPALRVHMDGGVHQDTVVSIYESGVDAVIVGSGIFGDGNASDNLIEFRNILDQE